ncbi:Diaminopimelate epimerase [Austwickia sp. TVS 96-490-7B]|uniref:diaminopimelate epimerase n=1 Tax=Austwickia sp. TVS 96-490-7B TaxID=2830843 RepID=UPI001C578A65|nr:diaminopimelate epimerase [Austwickia sp. TVS 96-490-7B]MBW3086473.1 Diaminopimelate epimerase [Austwickia sp. TVS 96-490-7B]
MTPTTLTFTKGHGTHNDFVLVPDPDGTLDLGHDLVQALADRHAGIGADGVIRVVPTRYAAEEHVRAQAERAEWFMDYRNADGSVAEMCGNGTRVFAAYLRREGWSHGNSFAIATRAGIKTVCVTDQDGQDEYAVNLGPWRIDHPDAFTEHGHDALVHLPGHEPWPGLSLNMGNPHTVVALPESIDLDSLDLATPPQVNPMPEHSTNVEFVQVLRAGHLRMRVVERGVGETKSCGTGACAAALACMMWSGAAAEHTSWQVDIPGGTVHVTALPGGEVELRGPAVLVADGQWRSHMA